MFFDFMDELRAAGIPVSQEQRLRESQALNRKRFERPAQFDDPTASAHSRQALA